MRRDGAMAWALAAWCGLAGNARAGDGPGADDPAAVAFFEAKVRPVLIERCGSCHLDGKAKGGLRLDSRELAIAGGPSGPAIVPGKPEESLLVEAIRYGDALQMPPKSKMPADEVEALSRWVETGAAWPTPIATSSAGGGAIVKPFDLRERAGHWSLQPIRDPAPPAVGDRSWPANAVDAFLLARLEAKGLAPAPEADRRALIRRLAYDLTGLPPTVAEADAFAADDAPDAYERLVDRLLASPRYGERWGRHWLDLVRFAETSGHEFDYNIPEAYRYRDTIVRALNADLPYDRFVVEHVAGDLLPDPRRDPIDGTNQSILATGFFRLHEGVHSPIDLRDDTASHVDNQIDVLGKAFLGLTIACARCHDHKFDAITTKDYYALSGFLKSSRHQLAFLDPPGRVAPQLGELTSIRAEVARLLGEPPAAGGGPGPVPADAEVFEDFDGPTYAGWFPAGEAFGDGPTGVGSWKISGDGQVRPARPGVADSGAISGRLRGVLRSRAFEITRKSIQVLAAGRGGRINVVIDGFEKIRAPIYGDLARDVDHGDAFRWARIDVAAWIGHRAYIELDDGATVDFTGNTGVTRDGSGFLAVDQVRFADGPKPPDPPPGPPPIDADARADLAPLIERYAAIEATIPEPRLGQALADGTAFDDRVHIRGSTRTLGEAVPRRFLEVLAGPDGTPDPGPGPGSGRLGLARRLVDPGNPLTARVIVNRLWHHHFGRGLVASVDDFGAMGRPPTHPELLDYLATQVVAGGWSLKAIHRLIVTSRAYRMASRPDPEADRLDPANELWHRRDLRRLEAEAIRDAILAVSGRLDGTLYGPSVPPHLTPFMVGRGRPARSGPLDGDGRRSIYLDVRRNFFAPMLLAFDFPNPSSTIGRRNVSNVPAQALTLLNDPFPAAQARTWADRIRRDPATPPAASIDRMYREAFARPPTPDESAAALAFLGDGAAGPAGWAELAHALFNVKEFVAIP